MEFKKLSLQYKQDNGNLIDILSPDMKKTNGFEAEQFYCNLDKIIREISQNNSFDIIRNFSQEKPIHFFGVLFYCLKDMDTKNNLEKEFDYLKKFIDYKIDLFMFVNYLRKI